MERKKQSLNFDRSWTSSEKADLMREIQSAESHQSEDLDRIRASQLQAIIAESFRWLTSPEVQKRLEERWMRLEEGLSTPFSL